GNLYPTAQCEILLNHLEATSADLRAAENGLSKSAVGTLKCRALLSRIIGDSDRHLKNLSHTVLRQPLWML
ncbi:MAG: hypothetical protein ACI8XC_003949, partial [Gammaproteobacteria bacterium]